MSKSLRSDPDAREGDGPFSDAALNADWWVLPPLPEEEP